MNHIGMDISLSAALLYVGLWRIALAIEKLAPPAAEQDKKNVISNSSRR